MMYNTGSRDDWDWMSKIGDGPSWSWGEMGLYRDRNQGYVEPNDGHDDVSPQ